MKSEKCVYLPINCILNGDGEKTDYMKVELTHVIIRECIHNDFNKSVIDGYVGVADGRPHLWVEDDMDDLSMGYMPAQ
jgi:hypothetical protein